MFDFGFSEVLLTSVIALIVLGPEKLPKAASQVGRWVGRARAMARQFREQLEEEVNLETVKKAHKEDEARREAEAKRTAADGSTGTTGATGTDRSAETANAAPGDGPDSASTGGGVNAAAGQSAGSAAGAANASAAPELPGGANHGDPYTQSAASPDAAFGDQVSPELAKIRADTYSHAHPTDEFGANPLTTDGAPPPSPVEAATGYTGAASAPPRPETAEAYASTSPPASDTAPPATDHSPTAPEKSGPA